MLRQVVSHVRAIPVLVALVYTLCTKSLEMFQTMEMCVEVLNLCAIYGGLSGFGTVLMCCCGYKLPQQQHSQHIRQTVPMLGVVRQKNMVISPAEPGTKNDCAGEGQQQFTRPTAESCFPEEYIGLCVKMMPSSRMHWAFLPRPRLCFV
jgi:hypothetical protein